MLWNRVLVAEHTQRSWQNASRVVIIRGRKTIVNIRIYNLEQATEKTYDHIQRWSEIELHFGSFRAQGHSAFIAEKSTGAQRCTGDARDESLSVMGPTSRGE